MSLYEDTFCALDIETTGVNPYKDRIIELGIVRFTYERDIDEYCTLMDPQIPISEQSFLVHGIKESEVKGQGRYSEHLDTIREFIGASVLVIQNPQFDLSFLQVSNRRAGKALFRNYSFDTVLLARKAFPDLKNHKLVTVANHLGVKRNFHRALDDARCCVDIFRAALNKLDPEKLYTQEKLSEICGFDTKERILKKLRSKRWRGERLELDREYEISYSDKTGVITKRKILAKNIFRNGSTEILHAFCYLRNEERYFKIKRIIKVESC